MSYQSRCIASLAIGLLCLASCGTSNKHEEPSQERGQGQSAQPTVTISDLEHLPRTATRYIITVQSASDSTRTANNVGLVANTLKRSGVRDLESLASVGILIVTANPKDLEAAVETGLIVQLKADGVDSTQ